MPHSASRRLALLITVVLLSGLTALSAPQRGGDLILSERLARIDAVLQDHVDRSQIAGAVALVLRDGRALYEKAFGWADKEAGRRMSHETVFRIASQTKAITSVAILMLMEEGRLALEAPVGRYIPAFSKTTVAVKGKSGIDTVPAARAITIRDLLTHTAGISYGTESHVASLYQAKGLGPAAGYGWYTADKDEGTCTTMERLATLPFVAQPGESYVYGYNTDILGCVVERVSGMPLGRFIEERITKPLGMFDTHFFLPAEKQDRLAAVYALNTSGTLVRAPDGARGQGHYVDGPRRNFAGGAGLVSTARDYARFLEMIRQEGELDGARILAPRTVALMTTNQVGTLYSTTGLGFGLGFQTVERYGAYGLASVGAFRWAGAYGSQYLVDPHARVTMVFMVQMLPNSTEYARLFPTLVYQAILDSPRIVRQAP